MYLMVASRTSALILSLKDKFPNRSVFGKLGKTNLGNWGSILLRLLILLRVLLFRKKGHWRRK